MDEYMESRILCICEITKTSTILFESYHEKWGLLSISLGRKIIQVPITTAVDDIVFSCFFFFVFL